MAEEEKNNNFKKILKGALGVGALALAVKNPDGALQVAGGLAETAMRERQELIKARGEELAKEKDYYRRRADVLFANKSAQYETDFATTSKLDNAMNSLVSASASKGASKEEIGMNILVAKGIIPNTGTKIDAGSGISFQLENEVNKIKDIQGEDGKVTGYTYEGTALPVRPKYENYFDSSKFTQAQEDIENNTVSTLTQKLFNKDDKSASVLQTLQNDMDSGYEKAIESDILGGKKTYEFKANASGNEAENGGFFDRSKEPVMTSSSDLSTLNSVWKSIQSKSTYGISTAVMGSVIPSEKIKDIVVKNDKGDITVRPDGQDLFDSINGLQVEWDNYYYNAAKYLTGDLTTLNEASVKKAVSQSFINRKIELDTDQFGYDIKQPIKGFYVIPTNIVGLGTNVPSTIVVNNEEVNTKDYLAIELNAIAEKYEEQGSTLRVAKTEMDAFVSSVLNPKAVTYIITDSGFNAVKDGNETINTWESFDKKVKETGGLQNSKGVSSDILAGYQKWLKTQSTTQESIKTSVDEQVNTLIPEENKTKSTITLENVEDFMPPNNGRAIKKAGAVGISSEFKEWRDNNKDSWNAFIDTIPANPSDTLFETRFRNEDGFTESVEDFKQRREDYATAQKEWNNNYRNILNINSRIKKYLN